MIRRFFRTALVLVLLAGCSGEPSNSDIKNAVQAELRAQMQKAEDQARAMGGDASVQMMRSFGSPAPEDIDVKNVEVLESRELDNGDYEMRISADTVAGGKAESSTSKIIMRNTDDGWRAQFP